MRKIAMFRKGKMRKMMHGEKRPGDQVMAVMWGQRCVGKLHEYYFDYLGIDYQRWHGYVLDEEVKGDSLNDVLMKCRKLFSAHGLRTCKLVKDDGFDVIMPAFEE